MGVFNCVCTYKVEDYIMADLLIFLMVSIIMDFVDITCDESLGTWLLVYVCIPLIKLAIFLLLIVLLFAVSIASTEEAARNAAAIFLGVFTELSLHFIIFDIFDFWDQLRQIFRDMHRAS